ncbi:unnamed protein product, partial [Ectocarpus sp. 13 AM-2016]
RRRGSYDAVTHAACCRVQLAAQGAFEGGSKRKQDTICECPAYNFSRLHHPYIGPREPIRVASSPLPYSSAPSSGTSFLRHQPRGGRLVLTEQGPKKKKES